MNGNMKGKSIVLFRKVISIVLIICFTVAAEGFIFYDNVYAADYTLYF